MTTTALSPADVKARCAALPGWEPTDDDFIRKSWKLGDFDRAMAFINAVADVARELDHHPNLSNVYDNVELAMQTHDAGGVTDRDFEFARRVEALGY